MTIVPVAIAVVEKPWGRELIWAREPQYAGKILEVRHGQRLSLQYHRVKVETMSVLEGRALIEIDGKEVILEPGHSITITPGTYHRLSAPFGDIRVLEASTPELDDVVRVQDDYNRRSHSHNGLKQACDKPT